MTASSEAGYADPAERYRLEERIATGGMGEVWRATDTVLARPVAVKLLKQEYADDGDFRARFAAEAQHAAALVHPGVAAVFDFGSEAGRRPFLVMELVEGQPLDRLLTAGEPMPADTARSLVAQAAEGVAAAHALGIVHRDLKPGNLLVTPDGRVKITDFGIARAAEGVPLTATGQIVGTPQYLSPEQARGEGATPASDVYALGVVLFECLVGRRPFVADGPVALALAHLNDPVPDLPDTVPADLAATVRRCLAKPPAERYADGAVLATALRGDESAAGATPAVPPVGPATAGGGATALMSAPATVTSRVRRRPGWLALVSLALLVALVGWWQLTAEREPAPTGSTPESETFDLREADYVGRPYRPVAAELAELGLEVTRERLANPGEETPGEVATVAPRRDLTEGSQVIVTTWGAVPEPDAPAGEPGGDPGGSDDKGEGKGKGPGTPGEGKGNGKGKKKP